MIGSWQKSGSGVVRSEDRKVTRSHAHYRRRARPLLHLAASERLRAAICGWQLIVFEAAGHLASELVSESVRPT
jgi:hypothetical protein